MIDKDETLVTLHAVVDDTVDETLRERVPVLQPEPELVKLLEMDGDGVSERDVVFMGVGEIDVEALGHLETARECDEDDESLFDPDDDGDAETDREVVGDGVKETEGEGECVVETVTEVVELDEMELVSLRVVDTRDELDGVAHDVVEGVYDELSEFDTVDELERHAVADVVDECVCVCDRKAVGETDREIVGVALIVRETDAVKVVEMQEVEEELRLGDADVDEQRVTDGDEELDGVALGEGEMLELPDASVDEDGLVETVVESLCDAVSDAHPEKEDVPEDDDESDGDRVVDELFVTVTETVDVGEVVTDGVYDPLFNVDGELVLECERDCVPVFERVAVPHDDGETVDVPERHAVGETERVPHEVEESEAHAVDDTEMETVGLTDDEPVAVTLPQLDGETLPLLVSELDCDTDDVPENVADAHEDTDGENDNVGVPEIEFDEDIVRDTEAHADIERETVEHEVTLLLMVELTLTDEQDEGVPLSDAIDVDELLRHDVGLSDDVNDRMETD